MDGWADQHGKSIYAIVIITPKRKQYIHSVIDVSEHSHTGIFNASVIENVINEVGPKKFAAIVVDGEAAMQSAIRIINQKYPWIIPMRCVAHLLNLITSDIVNLKWAKEILSDCQKLITFFRSVYWANSAFSEELKSNLISGGGLKTSVKTRWSTAWDCTESISRCETAIRQVNYLFY
jgi:hypothetical protein